MRKILLVTANPRGTESLRLAEECKRLIQSVSRNSGERVFQLEWAPACTDVDLSRALLDHRPEIVHFAGHGPGSDHAPSSRDLIAGSAEPEGLVFEDESGGIRRISAQALATLFRLHKATIRCVILNACNSDATAEWIARYIDYSIGMCRPISDQAALEFARGFYDALASGRSYEWAFDHGCAALSLRGLREEMTPVLKVNKSLGALDGGGAAPTPPRGSKPVPESRPAKLPLDAWDKDVLRSIESIVSDALGFDAHDLVRELAARTTDLSEMRRLIARKLPDTRCREAFRQSWPF